MAGNYLYPDHSLRPGCRPQCTGGGLRAPPCHAAAVAGGGGGGTAVAAAVADQ